MNGGICKECALSDKLLQGFSFFRIVKGKLKSGRSEIFSVLFLHSFVVYFSRNAESLKSALYQEKEQTLDIIDGLKLDIVTGKFINSSKQLTLYYSIGFYTTILRTFAINKRELDKILDLNYYMHFTDEE